MQNKDILIHKETLAEVRAALFSAIRSEISWGGSKQIDLPLLLAFALCEVFELDAKTLKNITTQLRLQEDVDYQSFVESVKSFNNQNIGVVEAYFLDPEVYGKVNVVISKIIFGVMAFGAVGTIAASGVAGTAFLPIAGIAAAYLCSSIMQTCMQKDVQDDQDELVQSSYLNTIDKPMMIAIEPFRLLLDKCADIIAMQIFSGKVKNLEQVSMNAIKQVLTEFDYGKPPAAYSLSKG